MADSAQGNRYLTAPFAAYQRGPIPREDVALTHVEAGSPMGWERYLGPRGRMLAMRRFGASAPDYNKDLSPGPLEIGFDEFFGFHHARVMK